MTRTTRINAPQMPAPRRGALSTAPWLALLSLAGCAQTGPATIAPPLPALVSASAVATPARPPAARPLDTSPRAAASNNAARQQPPVIIRGDDRVVARQPSAKLRVPRGQVARFRFDNAPVGEVVQIMLRDLLKVDYVVHPPLQGTVTLVTREAISADRALLLLETALQANGIVMARDSRGVYHVGTPDALRGIIAAPAVAEPGQPLPPGYGAVIIPLRYLGAGEMANILRPIVSPDAIVRVDTVRNLLVMRGTRAEAEGWLDLVATFDVNLLRGMSVGVFPLKYTSTNDVSAALRMLSGATSDAEGSASTPTPTPTPSGVRPGTPARTPSPVRGGVAQAAQAAAQAAGLGENNPLFGAIRVMTIDRLNAVMVVTPRAAYLDEIRYWIEQFDRPNINSNEPQLYVYKVKNGSADHLAELLNGIYGGGVLTQQPPGQGGNGVAPGLNTVSGVNGNVNNSGFGNNFGNNNFGNNRFGNSSFNNGFNSGFSGGMNSGMGGGGINRNNNQGGPGVTTTLLGDTVRVMADHINNTLLVRATPAEYERIEGTLKRLDVQRAQVLIEASIVEVALNNDLQYGLQWSFSNNHIGINGNNGYTGIGSIGNVNNLPAGGFTWQLKNSAGNIGATLSLLADKSLIKVISSPSLLVLDNQTASIQVGSQQPVSTGSVTPLTGDSSTLYASNSIQYMNTGVMLGVTPSVTAGDLVTMDINQLISTPGNNVTIAGQGYQAFNQRQINTQVSVRSGEAVVLGGLIQDNSQSGISGVPFLSSIPLIGALFGTHNNTNQRNELLVIITPRVLRSDEDARAVSREMRDRMRGLNSADLPVIRAGSSNTP